MPKLRLLIHEKSAKVHRGYVAWFCKGTQVCWMDGQMDGRMELILGK